MKKIKIGYIHFNDYYLNNNSSCDFIFYIQFADTTFNTIAELYEALRNKIVDGVLLDAYTVSSNIRLYDYENFNPVKLIKYPRYYGVVLSGDLANIARELGDNARAKENEILAALDSYKNIVPVCYNVVQYFFYRLSTTQLLTYI